MNSMFCDAEAFNQPLFLWDVSQVTDMSFMFDNAKSFKQENVEHIKHRAEEIMKKQKIVWKKQQ